MLVLKRMPASYYELKTTYLLFLIYMSEYFDDCQCVHVYIHACACVARMAFVLFVLYPLTLIPFSSVCLGITVIVLVSTLHF